jgi:membrane protease YdiL (CAAX protease family)
MAVMGALVMGHWMAPTAGFWITAALFFIAYGVIAFGLLLACRAHGIKVFQLIGPVPPVRPLMRYSLMAIPVFISSLGGAWLISLFAPHFFDSLLNDVLQNKPEGPFQIFLAFAMFVVVGPAVEEFTFRGLLFTRLSLKYSPRTALILSSLMFGLLHFDFVGAFIFGMVAASLYAHSRSLIAPFALHAVNNLIAFTGSFADPTSDAPIPSWLGLTGLVIGIALIAWLFARWTRTVIVPPYVIGERGA